MEYFLKKQCLKTIVKLKLHVYNEACHRLQWRDRSWTIEMRILKLNDFLKIYILNSEITAVQTINYDWYNREKIPELQLVG